jgi:hypothetical protein
MGQARLKKLADISNRADIKISPRKRAAGFILAHHNRVGQTNDEGVIFAINFFRVMDADGHPMAEETSDGPRPVLIASVPQPVRRSVAMIARI